MAVTVYETLGKWIAEELAPNLKSDEGILSVVQVPPAPGRNFAHQFKIRTARFDGTGNNPVELGCGVLQITYDGRARMSYDNCDIVPDFPNH